MKNILSQKKYKLLLFDADGTLFDYNKGEEFALEESFKHFSIDCKKKIYLPEYKKINQGLWIEFEKGLITSAELRIKRFKQFLEVFDILENPSDFSTIYLQKLSCASFLIEGAIDLVKDCSLFRKVIITNGIADVQHKRFDNSPIFKYFEALIISEEAGTPKPDQAIFEYTFKQIAYSDKKSVLIIGDSLTSDIQGGINFGIDTCWYNPEKKTNTSGIIPDYEIDNLNELLKILI